MNVKQTLTFLAPLPEISVSLPTTCRDIQTALAAAADTIMLNPAWEILEMGRRGELSCSLEHTASVLS